MTPRPIPLVDLRAQYREIQPELDAAVREVLERGDFILGAAVERFEKAFAEFIGVRHCVGVASGTDALALALRAMDVGPGNKVLVPANTFIATALAVTMCGATPVLADVEPSTLTLDVEAARRALAAGVSTIIPVHLYGQPADMSAVLEFAREKGIRVLEDAAQAHGAVHVDGRCGALGLASAFSFYPGKNLGAYGDGGAVCTDDESVADRLRLLRNWGSTVKYLHPIRGFNSRLDTIQAAVLATKLPRLESWNERRRAIAAAYRDALEPLKAVIDCVPEAAWTVRHAYHLFVIRLRKHDRDAVLSGLQRRGIGAGVHYPIPIHLQGAYADIGKGAGSFPVAEDAARRVLSLPLFPEMTAQDVARVVEALGQVVAELQ
jgi:dTDP-4-amino-4,6-dideoxygalactose transaminase